MGKKAKKSRLAGIPAWALSLMTFFTTIGLFELLEHIPIQHIPIPDSLDSFDTELILVALMYVIFLTAACFIICKAYPKSVWYTPFICNALIIFVVIMDQEDWIFLVSIIVISVIGAVVGAKIGRRKINQAK